MAPLPGGRPSRSSWASHVEALGEMELARRQRRDTRLRIQVSAKLGDWFARRRWRSVTRECDISEPRIESDHNSGNNDGPRHRASSEIADGVRVSLGTCMPCRFLPLGLTVDLTTSLPVVADDSGPAAARARDLAVDGDDLSASARSRMGANRRILDSANHSFGGGEKTDSSSS